MSQRDPFQNGDEPGFFRRYGWGIAVVAIAVVGVIAFGKFFSGNDGGPPRKAPEMVMNRPTPPPPPPTPPPPPPPQMEPKQQMMEQTPLENEEVKPTEVAPDPSPSLGTNLQGNGPPDGFGLSGKGGGFFGGNRPGGGGSGGSRFGWYAAQVTNSVSDALSRNARTRNASFNLKVRIWADVTGRIERVRLEGTTGDVDVDRAIKNEVLTGFQLKEPPPDGMPMPIVMRLNARRPG